MESSGDPVCLVGSGCLRPWPPDSGVADGAPAFHDALPSQVRSAGPCVCLFCVFELNWLNHFSAQGKPSRRPSACPKWSCTVPLGRGFWVHGKPGGTPVASGSGHHPVLASRPSQLPAAILRGWCARAVGGPGCKLSLGPLPSGLREDFGVDATKSPARSPSRPPWEGGVYACTPHSVPGDLWPLLKRKQSEHVACWDPPDRHRAAQSPSPTLGAGDLRSPNSGV